MHDILPTRMFTGIIENTAVIANTEQTSRFKRVWVPSKWTDLHIGESIAINGVCLTLAEIADAHVSTNHTALLGFDIIPETLRKTNLGALKKGDPVHVERAMRVGDRLGGHFVQGHVDGTGQLLHKTSTDSETKLRIQLPEDLLDYFIPRGSVCIDGVSLTVANLYDNSFEVALIPTTLAITRLADHDIGWQYNIEADMLAKSIVQFLKLRKSDV